MRCTPVASTRDEARREQRTVLRYEHELDDETEAVEREWVLHWHTQDGFRDLASDAGLVVVAFLDDDGDEAAPDADHFAALLQAADR